MTKHADLVKYGFFGDILMFCYNIQCFATKYKFCHTIVHVGKIFFLWSNFAFLWQNRKNLAKVCPPPKKKTKYLKIVTSREVMCNIEVALIGAKCFMACHGIELKVHDATMKTLYQ